MNVVLRQRDAAQIEVRSEILDVRKWGVVPIAADLQLSGLIHHMRVWGVVDSASLRLLDVEVEQPTVAFEPAEVANLESCRDPKDRILELRGEILDAEFIGKLRRSLGGPAGCTHVLAAAQLLASCVPEGLGQEHDRYPETARAAGERIFHRQLSIDGSSVVDQTLVAQFLAVSARGA